MTGRQKRFFGCLQDVIGLAAHVRDLGLSWDASAIAQIWHWGLTADAIEELRSYCRLPGHWVGFFGDVLIDALRTSVGSLQAIHHHSGSHRQNAARAQIRSYHLS